jgi:hypothetical protein
MKKGEDEALLTRAAHMILFSFFCDGLWYSKETYVCLVERLESNHLVWRQTASHGDD